MTTSKRFSGLMGSASEPTDIPDHAGDKTVHAETVQPSPAPSKSSARVQLNTQQPEELKAAISKAASYLSYTTGGKVTTTEVVERALREFLLSGTFPNEVTERLSGSPD